MDVELKVYRGEGGLSELAGPWKVLAGRVRNRRHIHRIEWYIAIARTFETFKNGTLICIYACSGSRPLVIMPFQIVEILDESGEALKGLELISNPTGEQSIRDILIDKDFEKASLLYEILLQVKALDSSWDVISFRGVLADSCALGSSLHDARLPVSLTPGGHWGKNEFVSCGSNDAPFSRLSKSFKQNLRTSHNKMKQNTVRFMISNDYNDLVGSFEKFLAIENSGWKGNEGTSVESDPVTKEFLSHLMKLLSSDSSCEIHIMEIDNKPIAALFCVVENNIIFIVRTGYDETAHLASPGHLVVENLLRTRGASGTIDSIAPYNAPPWFKAWRPDKILGIYNLVIHRSNLEAECLGDGSNQKCRSAPSSMIWHRWVRAALSLFGHGFIDGSGGSSFHIWARKSDWSNLIPAYGSGPYPTATRIGVFPVDIDPQLLCVGIYENGWVGETIRLDARERLWNKTLVMRGYVPESPAFENQLVTFKTKNILIDSISIGSGEFETKLNINSESESVEVEFSVALPWTDGGGRIVSCRLISLCFG